MQQVCWCAKLGATFMDVSLSINMASICTLVLSLWFKRVGSASVATDAPASGNAHLETDDLEDDPLTESFRSLLVRSASDFGFSPTPDRRSIPECKTERARSNCRRLKGFGRIRFESSFFDHSVACRIVARN
jgi:hypothetical protein